MKIGFVSYVNAFPLNATFRLNHLVHNNEIVYGPPALLNKLLSEKKLDVALTSSVAYFNHRDLFSFSSDFGIAAKEKVLSVNLYIKHPLRDGARIGVTPESATSVALLRLLCQQYWKIAPRIETLVSPEEEYDGFLLIGDSALRRQNIEGLTTIDLAKEWMDWTGLPFVFALFVYRKEVTNECFKNFFPLLRESYQWGQANPDAILNLAQKESGLSKKILEEYYNTLQYSLSKKELESLERFYVHTTKA